MIIDVHSHAWRYPEHFGDDFVAQAKRAKADGELDLSARYEDYRREATSPCSRTTESKSAARRLDGTMSSVNTSVSSATVTLRWTDVRKQW